MTVYPDASLLVAAFTPEAGHDAAMEWLSSVAPGTMIASRWCEVEFTSAIGVKVRRGEVRSKLRDRIVSSLRSALIAAATIVSIDELDFEQALSAMTSAAIPLRAGDALHLAIAARHGATVWTLDRRMAEAGQALGLGTRLLA